MEPAATPNRLALARALFDSGNVARARRELATAIELEPYSLQVQLVAAELHLDLGDHAGARAALVRAAEVGGGEDMDRLRVRLEREEAPR